MFTRHHDTLQAYPVVNRMRISTHAYCVYCKTNLCENGQLRCDRCLIRLTDDRVVFDTREELLFFEYLKCLLESVSNKACLCLPISSQHVFCTFRQRNVHVLMGKCSSIIRI